MSCISSNFSSFFLDSLNDPSEFAKYLSNTENKVHTMDEIYTTTNNGSIATTINNSGTHYNSGGGGSSNNIMNTSGCDGDEQCVSSSSVYNHHHENHQNNNHHSTVATPTSSQSHHHHHQNHHQYNQQQTSQNYQHQHHSNPDGHISNNPTSFDGSFEFSKFLKHHSEYGEETTPPTNNLIDLDSSTPTNRSNNSCDLDNFIDHDDSKHTFDVHNSNESSTGTGISSLDHNNKTSSNISECSDNSNQTSAIVTTNNHNSNNNNNNNNSSNNNNNNASKPLGKFLIRDNFDVHPAHKVEEGIFQHMNKLPNKKKETLKQLGVTFTGHMSIDDKSIIVDNFARFCEEYGVNDHRPFLTLNQSGMAKSEQIKFARYLGQGLPNFTLFCIYSNFKNLFCTKRFENYIKGSYNLHYILDKTKRFLSCTATDLKNLTSQQLNEGDTDTPSNNNGLSKSDYNNTTLNTVNSRTKTSSSSSATTTTTTLRPVGIDKLLIFENFEVHPSHRIEDGICTHMSRLSPKKQELLKQFGIQSNQNVTYQEKHTIIENFMKFCNEYHIVDHRPFLDFHECGLPKIQQIQFARYLGQGLPNLTLYKIYSAFKDLLALNRIEKLLAEGYNLETILKKKKKNLLNRISAIACKERQERAAKAAAALAAAQQAAVLQAQNIQPQVKLERMITS